MSGGSCLREKLKRVLRLGLRVDVPDLLNAMDMFCLASRSEGFPNVLGEAMACALPCITTDAGDASFVLGDDTWVVPTESPTALANALVRMSALDNSERRALGERNQCRVASEFSIRVAWKRYLMLYSQAAATI